MIEINNLNKMKYNKLKNDNNIIKNNKIINKKNKKYNIIKCND